MDRRQFSLLALTVGLAAGLSACGRRGALEPPPYTEQGREWAKRTGRDKQGAQNPQQRQEQKQGSVREGLQRDADQKGTVDVEAQVERNRPEGVAQTPSDPTRDEPGQTTVSPTGSRRRPPGIVPPKQSFILDGLLE